MTMKTKTHPALLILSRRSSSQHRDINTDNPRLGNGTTLHVTDSVGAFRSKLLRHNRGRIIRPA